MCKQIGQGKSQPEEVDYLLGLHPDENDLTWDAVNFFVTTAVQMYCPQYANR